MNKSNNTMLSSIDLPDSMPMIDIFSLQIHYCYTHISFIIRTLSFVYHIILNWKQGLAIITQKQMLNESFYLFKFSICSLCYSSRSYSYNTKRFVNENASLKTIFHWIILIPVQHSSIYIYSKPNKFIPQVETGMI